MNIQYYCGIDFHKNTSDLCVLDKDGKIKEQVKIKTSELVKFLSNRKDYLVGIEASGGTHDMATRLKESGHQVKLINPVQFKAIGLGGKKTDKKDAAIIATALRVGFIPEVHVKTLHARQLKSLIASRDQVGSLRVSITNHIRGILREFGLVIPKGTSEFWLSIHSILEELECGAVRSVLTELSEHAMRLKEQELQIERVVEELVMEDERVNRLQAVPGVGLLTAVAFVSSIDDITRFKSASELASYLGLVPREASSGGKRRLGSITKCGPEILRRYLIHGARTCLRYKTKSEHRQRVWAERIEKRVGANKATVALAHKNARICFAILKNGTRYNDRKKQKWVEDSSLGIAA
jgi:transposase